MTSYSLHAHRQRLLTRAAQTLLGICTGIAADGRINDTEILFLRTWLTENKEVMESWPGDVIGQHIEALMTNGGITEEARQHFLKTLQSITGNAFHETGSAVAECPALPITPGATITFKNHTFCFTGTFRYGKRHQCENDTQNLGGIPIDRITLELDYLVIGSMVTSSWALESYGRKIEKAANLQKEKGRPQIISEQQWVDAMKALVL